MHALLTPTLALFGLGAPEIMLILALFLLLFGAKRLPELARGFGKSISEFKKASAEAERDIHQAINEPAKTTPPPAAKPGVNPPTGNN